MFKHLKTTYYFAVLSYILEPMHFEKILKMKTVVELNFTQCTVGLQMLKFITEAAEG